VLTALRQQFRTWLFRPKIESGTVTLNQRRIFILPTKQGLGFACVLLLMLLGDINYNLSLGYALTFLLATAGAMTMLHAFRNMAQLEVRAGRTTSPAENKALMRRFVDEVWNQGHLEVADELFHPEASSPSAPALPRGAEGVKVIAGMFRSAFPDYWMTIDLLLAEGDRVAARFTQGGTHQGDLFGIAPTGKSVTFTEMGVLRVADGRVVESWYVVDMAGLMQQLGVGG